MSMVKFTVLLPIHNEESYLPYSLPSVYELSPDEVILLFDRCIDNSEKIAYTISERYKMLDKTLFVNVPESPDWRFRSSFLRVYGTKLAKHDLVLLTNADIILNPQITRYFILIGNNDVALISFMYKDFPVDYRNLLKRLLISTKFKALGNERWLTGIMLFSKRVALESEDFESLKQIESAEDTHLHIAITKRYRSLCFNLNIIHLRPRGSSRDLLRGRLLWAVSHRSFLHVLLTGIMFFRLNIIKGYIQERWGNKNDSSLE
jgi:glycosyltransferase involved in cell wall biosynthesis